MSSHIKREMQSLNESLLSLAGMVEQQVFRAVKSLMMRDLELALIVCTADETIDHREIQVEEECLKVLALYQPVARDLRSVVATLKITSDLERIGDLAVNIAKKVEVCVLSPPTDGLPDLSEMAELVLHQLRMALDAMVRQEVPLAEQVCCRDVELNTMKKGLRQLIESRMQKQPEQIPVLLALLGAVRNLERIGDHATNIAEDVIYTVSGRIIRHELFSDHDDG